MGSNSTTCDSWSSCTEESCYQTCWCLSMTCCLDQSPRDAYTLRNPAEKACLPGWTKTVLKQFWALFRLTTQPAPAVSWCSRNIYYYYRWKRFNIVQYFWGKPLYTFCQDSLINSSNKKRIYFKKCFGFLG